MSITSRLGLPRLPQSSSQVKYLNNKNESINYSTVDTAENVTAGSVLSRLVALDPDTGAQLQYRLDTARCAVVLCCTVLYCTVILYCTAGARRGPGTAGWCSCRGAGSSSSVYTRSAVDACMACFTLEDLS